MANIDEKHLDDRCKELRGKIDWSQFPIPPDFKPFQFVRCIDMIDKGIKLKNDENNND